MCDDEDKEALSAAQRARSERNRLKARALRESRVVQPTRDGVKTVIEKSTKSIDSGAGFFLEEEPAAPKLSAAPAPLVHASEQPECLECNQPFPQSYLLDTFDYRVCDACRDDEEAHALLTRTEAKSEYLLKDCDLDLRPPALRCVRRRNPHRARFADMRLYLRAQVAARARDVWGSDEGLAAERERQAERRARAAGARAGRELRALRMSVRSSLYDRTRAPHEHRLGEERYDAEADLYSRACDCGYTQTYEKM